MHDDTRDVQAEVALPRSVEVVPQVVFVDEPVTVFSASGSPQMSNRRVPYTRWVAFSPVDYARFLRRWSAANMPAAPQPGVHGGAAVLFGLVLVVAAAGMLGGGISNQSPGLLVGALVCGSMGCAFIGETRDSASRRRMPGASMARSASWSRGEAYVALEQDHFGRAAALQDNALWAQQIAEQQREAARWSAEHARRTDEQYWTDLASWPQWQQWQAAEAFRASIAREWARRMGGGMMADASLIPGYADVVAWLRATPSPW